MSLAEGVREALRARLAALEPRVIVRAGAAAVLVAVVEAEGGLELLLTRRTETVGSHRGQVAFPGGGAEPGDAGPEATALREAEEEVALVSSAVEVLGRLDAFPTVTDTVAVTPVVGWVKALPPLRAQADEVARIFRVPFEALHDPGRWRGEEVEHLGRRYPLFFFDWDGEVLWGLSAYITLALLELTPQGAPFPLPRAAIR